MQVWKWGGVILGIAAVVTMIVVVAVSLLDQRDGALPNAVTVDMGISYLPVTPGVSDYYGLGVDSGALVTEVAPDSMAARAGVVVGDVILTFNGAEVREESPLLGAMRNCPAGNVIALEVWRGQIRQEVELIHSVR